MIRLTRVFVLVMILALSVGLAGAQEEETKKKNREGRRKGAAGGALVGLTLGALTGDAGLAAKGAVAGGVVGGVTGDMYDYDQSRQDDRTQMLADGIAGSKQTVPGETVGSAGRRHFEDLGGEWKLDIWYMGLEGKKLGATGTARGLAAGDNSVRVLYQNVTGDDFEGTVSGQSLLRYDPGQGFFLDNSFSVSEDEVQAVGEFLVDKNAYNFYVMEPTGGEMVSGGILRSNVRVELRIVSPTLWIAETFTFIDGEETKVQTYRFTRPQ